jgi:hypothetical protein
MAIFIFVLGFLLLSGSDSYAQVYKYVNKQGAVCFTDSPPPTLFKGRSNKEEAPKTEVAKETTTLKRRAEIKDIIQMGQEILEEELAKPLAKQNRRLIQEMTEILYGDVSAKKPK